MVDVIRYAAGGCLSLLGVAFIGCTYAALFSKREGGYSFIPFVGPLALISGIAITPLPFSHWLWLAFLVDLNSVAIPASVKLIVESVMPSSPSDGE